MTDSGEIGDRLIKPLPRTLRGQAVKIVSEHSFRLVKQLLDEFYQAPHPRILFDEETGLLDIEGTGPQEDALMKLLFSADIHGQARKPDYHYTGSMATRGVILEAHKAVGQKPARTFTAMMASTDRNYNPYWEMRSLRRNREGRPIRGGYGINYAASALVGSVTLVDPVFSAEIPDDESRQLLKRVFLLD